VGDPSPNQITGGTLSLDHTTTHSISYAFAIAGRSALTPDLLVVGNEANRYIRRSTDQGSRPEQLLSRLVLRSLKGLVDDPAQVRAITINYS